MTKVSQYKATLGDREVIFETGKLAEQAGGAVTLRDGDTLMLATATMSKKPRSGVNFLPLSVDFEERLYSVGRIPGNWFRREGRPPVSAILTCRLVDRPLRPLFDKNMRNEIQVILYPLSHDQENQSDVMSITAASAAVMISNIPWEGPVAGVRVALIDDEFIINPTYQQMDDSTLDLRMAVSSDAILMVECAADEVPEAVVIEALKFGFDAAQPMIQVQLQMREDIGKEKTVLDTENNESEVGINSATQDRIREIVTQYYDSDERDIFLEDLKEQVMAEYELDDEYDELLISQMRDSFSSTVRSETRRHILEDGVRPDGRDYVTIRELSAETHVAPRVHGSGLFKRGQTQVLSLATLGTPRDAMRMDGIEPAESKRYLHHYNFPPFSTGETWFMRGPKRREIGHGALAEAALMPVIPNAETFPYTLRVVSEVLSSNGSTSMASVCGSSLSLLAAGVPLKAPVAGIAMGLITDGENYAILTDIQGLEDHIGDMDFKVAGTADGITALQMDIKIKGLSDDIMAQALNQARDARLQILDVMNATISEPAEMSPFAPRLIIIKIDPEKIGAIIGPGGKTVRSIQEQTGVVVDIEEDGTIYIASADGEGAARAREIIEGLVEEAELGRIYTGRVVRVEAYGAFVEILPGKDGLVHISQLASGHIESVESEVNLGDEIMVMVTAIDSDGKVRLSRQAVLEGWTPEEAAARDRGGSGGRGGSRGGRGGGNRGGGNRGGGNRGGGSRGGGDRRR